MLGKRHFRILETVTAPTTRQELAHSLEYTPKTITNVLGDSAAHIDYSVFSSHTKKHLTYIPATTTASDSV